MDSRPSTTTDDRSGRTERETERGERSPPTSSRGLGGLVGRRTCLKAVGAYAAGRALLGVSGSAAAAPYTTYEVDAGETFERRLGDGETFGNALVDVRADGAGFDITAEGSDWTIRNVGIRGRNGTEAQGSAFRLNVDEGSNGTFENVYLGDGAVDGDNDGIFVPLGHAGTLTVRRCHVANWPDNGIYASAPGRNERDGQKGVVRIVDSYAYNNNIAGFRLGTDGSSIERSVVHVDSDVPNNAGGKENARGIWVKEGGSVRIEECDVRLDHPDGTICIIESNDDPGRARVVDSAVAARNGGERFGGNVSTKNVTGDPDVSVPSRVPESAKAAARGPSGGSSGSRDRGGRANDRNGAGADAARRIAVAGGDSDDGEFVEYAIETSGGLRATDATEDGEKPAGKRATGATGGSRDVLAYSGAIETLDATLKGSGGQQRASVAIGPNGDESSVRISGGNGSEDLRYELEVTGSIRPLAYYEDGGSLPASRVEGLTDGGFDMVAYTGKIVSLRAALPPNGPRFLVEVATDL